MGIANWGKAYDDPQFFISILYSWQFHYVSKIFEVNNNVVCANLSKKGHL